jgi:hypothetical protein
MLAETSVGAQGPAADRLRPRLTRRGHAPTFPERQEPIMDDQTRLELEAAAFRRLRDHLRKRTDVQNIDMMNLTGFCRNCLSRWYSEAASERGIALDKDAARETVYGMPYDEWKARHQSDADADTLRAFEQSFAQNVGTPKG